MDKVRMAIRSGTRVGISGGITSGITGGITDGVRCGEINGSIGRVISKFNNWFISRISGGESQIHVSITITYAKVYNNIYYVKPSNIHNEISATVLLKMRAE